VVSRVFKGDEIPGSYTDLFTDSSEAEGEDIAADGGGGVGEFEAGAREMVGRCVVG